MDTLAIVGSDIEKDEKRYKKNLKWRKGGWIRERNQTLKENNNRRKRRKRRLMDWSRILHYS